MNEPIQYVPKTSAKEVQTRNGSLLKLSFHAETVACFMRDHKNEKGYVNFTVANRKSVGKYGETHSVWLDTWKPNREPGQAVTAAAPPAAPGSTAAPADEDQDVPF